MTKPPAPRNEATAPMGRIVRLALMALCCLVLAAPASEAQDFGRPGRLFPAAVQFRPAPAARLAKRAAAGARPQSPEEEDRGRPKDPGFRARDRDARPRHAGGRAGRQADVLRRRARRQPRDPRRPGSRRRLRRQPGGRRQRSRARCIRPHARRLLRLAKGCPRPRFGQDQHSGRRRDDGNQRPPAAEGGAERRSTS